MIRVSDAAQGVRTGPVARVLTAGLTRRPVQAIVTGLVLDAWVDVDVAVAICGLTSIAALLPALRSARPSAAPPTASALRTERSVP